MCGIAGIFDLQGKREVNEPLLSQMNQSQFHRGPDEGGLYLQPGLGLAHRRLSILDLSSGHQPFHSVDGRLVTVFNGEIYNFQEVRQELQQLGYLFQTHCDTEVLIYAWHRWGVDSVQRFRGMFAFAIWERDSDQLWLVRDRLGVKPLFYSQLPNGQLIFGSELKVLTAHPELPRELLPEAIEDYFAYGYVPEPKTIYRNVFKLGPGEFLHLERGKALPAPQRYWDIPALPQPQGSLDELEQQLIAKLREATAIRMVADVPLGAFLSGGVDSSAVVAMMAQSSDSPVNTCSIAFDDPKFNESDYAQKLAERYQTNHRTKTLDPDDFSLLDQLARIYDEPYADSSAMPTYRVCELAREQVTVALSGDGADEHLAGYRRYMLFNNEQRLRSLLPQAIRGPIFGILGRVYPKLDWMPQVFRAKTTFQSLARDSVAGYFHGVSIFKDEQRQALFSNAFKKRLNGYNAIDVMRSHAKQAPYSHPLTLIQYLDMKTYLPGDILTKVDRASMAHSLEVRSPFLDHKLIEWVFSLPPELKLKGSEGKFLLKKALEPHVPHDIMYRRKMGFAVPLASWFRGPLKQKLRDEVLGSTIEQTGFFNRSYLEHLVDEHQAGRRDYSAPLWSLLMFSAFLRQSGL